MPAQNYGAVPYDLLEETMESLEKVILLEDSQRDRAVEVLFQAFHDDVMYVYAFPDVGRRVRALRRLWLALVVYCLRYGKAYTTPTVRGAACWLPPGGTEPTFWRMLRTGMTSAIVSFDVEDRRRFLALVDHVDEMRKRLMGQRRYWYLWALGVAPAHQGQGIGNTLIQPILRRADEDGLPCYLETETERNAAFYERRGFEVVSHGPVAGHGVRMWAMLREPG